MSEPRELKPLHFAYDVKDHVDKDFSIGVMPAGSPVPIEALVTPEGPTDAELAEIEEVEAALNSDPKDSSAQEPADSKGLTSPPTAPSGSSAPDGFKVSSPPPASPSTTTEQQAADSESGKPSDPTEDDSKKPADNSPASSSPASSSSTKPGSSTPPAPPKPPTKS